MLHLRITLPGDRAQVVVDHLVAEPGVAHVSWLPGASVAPPGDLVLCDVVREVADDVVEWLQAQDVHHEGSISLDMVDTVVSDAAARAEQAVPGHGSDGLVWEAIDARTRDDALLTPSLLVLMGVASAIAAVGIVLDSPILIIGAMVVGPEYGPIAALSVGAVRRRGAAMRRAATTLVALVAAGVASAAGLVGLLRLVSAVPDGYELTERQLTAFIARPDTTTIVVAVLAGVAGMLSLTQARAGTLVGVLVSVTTIPAIADIGLAAAYGEGGELQGAAAQLGANLLGLLVAGAATLALQARLTRHR